MRENMPTNQYPKLSEGKHEFKILSVSERIPTPKTHYRKWIFISEDIEIRTNLFPWEAAKLLIALGYEEKDNSIEWDDEEVIGKPFSAVCHYEISKKDGKEYPKLDMFEKCDKTEIPF
jgi:hypothetical protein